ASPAPSPPATAAAAAVESAPYRFPSPKEAEWQKGLGCLLEATCSLAESFSAADAIGGVSLGRGWGGAGPPSLQGGDHFISASGPPWAKRDPRVVHGFVEDEAETGPCFNANGLPRTLWDGACDRYRSLCATTNTDHHRTLSSSRSSSNRDSSSSNNSSSSTTAATTAATATPAVTSPGTFY
ncbi:unnamed protein product, partial [Laminaria digitata]